MLLWAQIENRPARGGSLISLCGRFQITLVCARMQSKPLTLADRWGARWGIAGVWAARFYVPLRNLSQLWYRSNCIRAADEIRNLPLRIQATLRHRPILGGRGWALPQLDNTKDGLELLQSCNEDIQSLREDNPWMTSLDSHIAVEGWKKGFQSALRVRILDQSKESKAPYPEYVGGSLS